MRHAEAGGRLARALGLDAATPTTSAPARRAERTWTGPMKPVAPTTRGAAARAAGGGQNGTPSSAFFASTSMPCRRARFSPRILRLACSVSGG